MINSDYGLDEKRLEEVKRYAYIHKMSIAKVIRISVDRFLKQERIKDNERMKGRLC